MIDRPHLKPPVTDDNKLSSVNPPPPMPKPLKIKNRSPRVTGRCTVCRHNERSRIEHLLALGIPRLSIATKFGLSQDSLYRHFENHCPPSMRAASVAKALKPSLELDQMANEESSALLQHLANLRAKCLLLFDAAVEAGHAHNASLMHARILENLRMTATLTGELLKHSPTSINLSFHNPDVLQLIYTIRAAVSPFPAAREAVKTALAKLETEALNKLRPSPSPISSPLIEGEVSDAA